MFLINKTFVPLCLCSFVPVVIYWFFYPYNDWVNDHEGDWEHINIILTNQIPEMASIAGAQYYFHHNWMPVSKNELRYPDEDGDKTHPIVYIGGSGELLNNWESRSGENSGGSYPWPGRYTGFRSVLKIFFNQDDVVYGWAIDKVRYTSFTASDDQPNDNRCLELLKDPSYFQSINFYADNIVDKHAEYSWFNTSIGFGEPNSELVLQIAGDIPIVVNINSLLGPVKNSGWKDVGSSSGFSLYDKDKYVEFRFPH